MKETGQFQPLQDPLHLTSIFDIACLVCMLNPCVQFGNGVILNFRSWFTYLHGEFRSQLIVARAALRDLGLVILSMSAIGLNHQIWSAMMALAVTIRTQGNGVLYCVGTTVRQFNDVMNFEVWRAI